MQPYHKAIPRLLLFKDCAHATQHVSYKSTVIRLKFITKHHKASEALAAIHVIIFTLTDQGNLIIKLGIATFMCRQNWLVLDYSLQMQSADVL